MVGSYGAQQYAYQILTAVAYALENLVDAMAIEGPGREDSLFRKGDVITIGEAKYITSQKHWTLSTLFYSGDNMGPLTQLWNRWSGNEKLVLFSPIPDRRDLSIISPLRISGEERDAIIEHIKNRVHAVRRVDEFLQTGIDDVLKNTHFEQVKFVNLNRLIIDWADLNGIEVDSAGIARVHLFFSSDAYQPGKWVARESVLAKLAKDRNETIIARDHFDYEILFENKMADKVHFALLWPRTIDKCLAFVYGINGEQYRQAVAYTIAKLQEKDFVREVGTKSGSPLFKSTYKPTFEFCRKNILERAKLSKKADYEGLNNVDKAVFEKVFESKWWSELLTENIGCFHSVAINRATGLQLYEGLTELAEFWEVISQICACFGSRSTTGPIVPTTKEFNGSGDFDAFAEQWTRNHLAQEWLEPCLDQVFERARKYLGDYACTRILLESVRRGNQFLCVPKDFAWKMSRAHRIQLTIAIAFCEGFEKS